MDRLQVTAPSVKEMRRYLENSKPGPVSSKPGMSKAIVEPRTDKADKRPRLEVHDVNLLGDSSPPKRIRVTKARLDRKRGSREGSRGTTES